MGMARQLPIRARSASEQVVGAASYHAGLEAHIVRGRPSTRDVPWTSVTPSLCRSGPESSVTHHWSRLRTSKHARYHGVFGPASAWRSQIVPRPQESTPGPCPAANTASPPPEARARRETSRIPWAELLLRVFREDVLVCPCGGRRVLLAFITEKKVVKEILEHLGLPPTGPPIAPARITAAGEDAPWQDEVPELQQTLRLRRPDRAAPLP